MKKFCKIPDFSHHFFVDKSENLRYIDYRFNVKPIMVGLTPIKEIA